MKKFFRAALCAAALTPLISVCACSEAENKNYVKYLYSMGTLCNVVVPQTGNSFSSCSDGEEKFNAFADEVASLLTSADNSLSATLASSCIYAFNEAEKGATVEIDKTAYEVLCKARDIYNLTEGYYNPAVYYCVKAYGFPLGSTAPSSLPAQQEISAFCELASHFNEVSLYEKDGKYYAVKPNYSLALDLGGIGKGWCADKVGSLMTERGYDCGTFNFSSSSIAIKSYAFGADGYYTLELRDPRGEGSFCSLKIKNCNLSTSGDYMQYYELDGVRYCHIINPKTGSPIQTGVASVTVIGGSAMEDDAYTTALSCMEREKAVEFINENLSDRMVIMLIFEGGEGKIITNRPQDITIKNTQYRIINGVENGRIVLNNVA